MFQGERMRDKTGGGQPTVNGNSVDTRKRKPRPARVPRAIARKKQQEPGTGTRWRRVKDNWQDLLRLGYNENFGTTIGRLFMFRVLSEEQASAAMRYAGLVGRFDRYHGLPGTKRTAASPAYERGYGSEDEIVKRERDGSITDYERRARRAKKQWDRCQEALPRELREITEEAAVYDREINSAQHPMLIAALSILARTLGFSGNTLYEKRVTEDPPAVAVPRMATVIVRQLRQWADKERGTIERFRLASRRDQGMYGAMVYGHTAHGQKPLCTARYVASGKISPEALNAGIKAACLAEGWKEETGGRAPE
jgi:hypothetical protein